MQIIQQRLKKDCTLRKPYAYGSYNKIKGNKQAIRITEGCVWNCSPCHEPTEIKIFGIPKIERNYVLIFDMNLLCKKEALQIIEDLGKIKVNNKVVYYELVCGVDYRFLTEELAEALYTNRFKRIRYAWDSRYNEQKKIKKGLDLLLKAGYKNNDIMIFIICNYLIAMTECDLKLDLCKVWNVKACDCYFDGQVMPNVIPMYWSMKDITYFRSKVRKHNQLVNFKIDPEVEG